MDWSPAISASIAATRLDSPSWPRITLRNPGSNSGADPSVINGSVRALRKLSATQSRYPLGEHGQSPRVCWYCESACHFRWKTDSVAGWKG
jgi:hypothetical protein